MDSKSVSGASTNLTSVNSMFDEFQKTAQAEGEHLLLSTRDASILAFNETLKNLHTLLINIAMARLDVYQDYMKKLSSLVNKTVEYYKREGYTVPLDAKSPNIKYIIIKRQKSCQANLTALKISIKGILDFLGNLTREDNDTLIQMWAIRQSDKYFTLEPGKLDTKKYSDQSRKFMYTILDKVLECDYLMSFRQKLYNNTINPIHSTIPNDKICMEAVNNCISYLDISPKGLTINKYHPLTNDQLPAYFTFDKLNVTHIMEAMCLAHLVATDYSTLYRTIVQLHFVNIHLIYVCENLFGNNPLIPKHIAKKIGEDAKLLDEISNDIDITNMNAKISAEDERTVGDLISNVLKGISPEQKRTNIMGKFMILLRNATKKSVNGIYIKIVYSQTSELSSIYTYLLIFNIFDDLLKTEMLSPKMLELLKCLGPMRLINSIKDLITTKGGDTLALIDSIIPKLMSK